jgi:hypothetical protein
MVMHKERKSSGYTPKLVTKDCPQASEIVHGATSEKSVLLTNFSRTWRSHCQRFTQQKGMSLCTA